MTIALELKQLKKTYPGGVQALRGIDLQVEAGDFYALLGPNGAGKSTTIGIISSLVNKTSGQVNVFGYDLEKDVVNAKRQLGLVPQEFNFNPFETVQQIVVNQAGYYGVERKEAVARSEKYLKQLDLWEKRNERARMLSGGMKRRLMIARALMHEPKLLILDEPTAGVDIELRRSMWGFLKDLNDRGTTIILTTHYLEEAEMLCRNIGIIQHGALVENTRRLLDGRQACNILLYGDKGTGKSATVKALLSSFWLEGLRIVEVPLAQLTNLPTIFSILREQPGKFIVFVDDLAFNDSCPEYTALKTVLEGGLEARPSNVVVYATSNRRNIVRQRFSERQDDVNERDTLEEKFSLADRFDLRLTFSAPTQEEYFTICRALLDARGVKYDWETLMPRARAWTVSHNGCSPRIARQFVDYIAGGEA